MSYAVVVCPRCGQPRLARCPFKTARCFYCGKTMTDKNAVAKGLSREEALVLLVQIRSKGKPDKR